MSAERNRRKVNPGLIVFLIPLIVYLKTMSQDVGRGDSGEFQTLPYVLGIAHPTGYPTYILVGRVFTFIPLGPPASNINLMNVLFASLSVLLVYSIMKKFTGECIASSASALTLAFSQLYWKNAVVAEAYILNSFFLLSCLLILLKWGERREDRLLYLFGILYGFGLGNHMSLLLYAPVYAVVILSTDYRVVWSRRVFYTVFFVGVGCSVYLYVLLRDTPETPMNYVYEFSLEHGTFDYSRNSLGDRVERVLWLVRGRQYRSDDLTYRRLTNLMEEDRLELAWHRLKEQVTLYGIILGVIGLAYLLSRNRFMFAVTGLFFILNLVRFGGGMIDHSIPSVIMCSMWIGFGIKGISGMIQRL
jgi:4-amino-4-deoxy-L-arabinose transferase-like glycosyltransferase